MDKSFIIMAFVLFSLIFGIFFVSADSNTVNFPSPSSTATFNNANIFVQVLKYDPYPVSAGEWFDVWVQVQNLGQQDAKDVKFELVTSYPFTNDGNTVIEYPTLSGSLSASKLGQSGDGSTAILKYRVRVADNSPTGTSNLKLKTTLDSKNPTSQGVTTDLPIVIGKTKTDFEVVLQDSSTQGTAFSIANTGENAATAVVLSVVPKAGLNISGATSSILGNLDKGEFTTVTFQVFPTRAFSENSDRTLNLKIAYTDTAGVRNVVEKNVTVNMQTNYNPSTSRTGKTTSSSGLSWYIWLIVGIILGIIINLIYRKIRKKK